ncbi:MAG: hypothetical protein J6W03_06310 [Bacteroidaceae bacterium]|nr:hypothetical protein [Bacteroidaceae bacterium]
MDKHDFINDYLQGRHPIEQDSWELPTESELDRDEALYDALLAERPSKSPLKGDFTSHLSGGLVGSWGRFGMRLWAAAAILIAVALFTWWNFKPQDQPQLAEKTEEPVKPEKVASDTSKHNVVKMETSHVKLANLTREVSKVHVPRLKSSQPTSVEEPQVEVSEPVLTNAADSLYYYLTQLENQMGDCRDSTCLAELTGLMQADERIKDLVNKIIHKQVETAYQEEYLVDTTTRYIPL